MPVFRVTVLKPFSTTVDVEADSAAEARDLAFENEPNDSIIGFDWEPDGESEAIAVYDEEGQQIWSDRDKSDVG